MKKLLSVILSITMLLSIGTVAFADNKNGFLEENKKIKVGINAEFKPFEYYENGVLNGFDIELMNYIGDRAGIEIEYIDMPFEKLIPAVISGEVMCAISAISITEERNKLVDYSIPYLTASITFTDGETTDTSIDKYAIVFPESFEAKGKIVEAAGYEDTFVYNLMNKAITELIKDKTIEKLCEKYNINEAADTKNFNYEFYKEEALLDDNTPDKEIPHYESWEELGLVNPLPRDWAKGDIEKADSLNITQKGKGYIYTSPITREEFCELIYNYCSNVIGKLATYDGENKFTDTNNPHILMLNAMGIINGKTETQFAPDDQLTREEAAVILERMVNKTIPVPVTEMYFNFDDEKAVSDWAMNSVQTICNMGVMNGVGENRFAPQDTYTTEQAISTIVRVYGAQSSNMVEEPLEIHIGENVGVDAFYIKEAIKHTKKAGELAGTKEFIALYTSDEDVAANIEKLSKTDFENPLKMYYVSYNIDKVVEYYNNLLAEENNYEEFDVKRYIELNGFNLSYFATRINAFYGSKTLVATSVLTSREGYIMPKDFKEDFGIYLQYDGEYSALVSFSKIGEGVIDARMQFVKNGEKADMLSFMSEVYDALGTECITTGEIK